MSGRFDEDDVLSNESLGAKLHRALVGRTVESISVSSGKVLITFDTEQELEVEIAPGAKLRYQVLEDVN